MRSRSDIPQKNSSLGTAQHYLLKHELGAKSIRTHQKLWPGSAMSYLNLLWVHPLPILNALEPVVELFTWCEILTAGGWVATRYVPSWTHSEPIITLFTWCDMSSLLVAESLPDTSHLNRSEPIIGLFTCFEMSSLVVAELLPNPSQLNPSWTHPEPILNPS